MGRKWLPRDPQEAPKGAQSDQNDSHSVPQGSKWELIVPHVRAKNPKVVQFRTAHNGSG